MKTTDQKTTGLAFGFSAVNAGQRNATTEPQLIAVSTEGNFRITPQVSKLLNVGHGEYIMFVSNVNEIDRAIAEKAEVIVDFCAANGLELGSPEALLAIHSEFDVWGITKGFQEFDAKGNPKMGPERLTKADKAKYVATNFDAMLESALASEDGELVDALSREDITKEEQSEILAKYVQPADVIKFTGSKAANSGAVTGPGTSLTFTDSNVWKQIKADMKDDATKLNRVFDIDVDNIQTVELSNGHQPVKVSLLLLSDYVDKEPARVGTAAAAEEGAE